MSFAVFPQQTFIVAKMLLQIENCGSVLNELSCTRVILVFTLVFPLIVHDEI